MSRALHTKHDETTWQYDLLDGKRQKKKRSHLHDICYNVVYGGMAMSFFNEEKVVIEFLESLEKSWFRVVCCVWCAEPLSVTCGMLYSVYFSCYGYLITIMGEELFIVYSMHNIFIMCKQVGTPHFAISLLSKRSNEKITDAFVKGLVGKSYHM